MTARQARKLSVQGYLGLVRFRLVSLILGFLVLGLLPYLLYGFWRLY